MPASPLANAPETLSATASNHHASPVAPRLRPSRSILRTWGAMSVRTRAFVCASLAIILVAALGVGTATAQRAEQRAWCAGQFGVALRQRIDACTAVIDSGRLDGPSLSSALSDRSEEHTSELQSPYVIS